MKKSFKERNETGAQGITHVLYKISTRAHGYQYFLQSLEVQNMYKNPLVQQCNIRFTHPESLAFKSAAGHSKKISLTKDVISQGLELRIDAKFCDTICFGQQLLKLALVAIAFYISLRVC